MSSGHPSSGFEHEPVMAGEIASLLADVPEGTVVDATVGGGGHAAAILDANPAVDLVGIDRDPDALEASRARLSEYRGRVSLHRARFDEIGRLVAELGRDHISGAVFDLGVSSPQIDRDERGFSYHRGGPIDMRMDPGQELSAAEIVNEWPADQIARLLRDYADERRAGRIAAAIVAARPLETTDELAEVIAAAVPGSNRRRAHPARRTFQALRIEVNDELAQLPTALRDTIELLEPGGRAAAISYHSGEDRIVKQTFRDAAEATCTCPRGGPCVCDARPTVLLLRKGGVAPTDAEVERNPRASSARLRAVEKLPTTGDPS